MVGTNLKISPFSYKHERARADFIHLFHMVLRKEERVLWKQAETLRGRYLASGLEPVCKFNSCFYQMGANPSQNKRALVCTVLNPEEKKEKEAGEI